MLERQVEVRNTRIQNGMDEVVTQITWVEVEQPHTVDQRRNGVDQRNNGSGTHFFGAIFAVAREVLSNQNNFSSLQLFYFC